MAKLVRLHHDSLQDEDIDTTINPDEFSDKMNNILDKIPEDQHLPEPERTSLNWKRTEEQINQAIHLAKDGTATTTNNAGR